jgi:hypothetical protein
MKPRAAAELINWCLKIGLAWFVGQDLAGGDLLKAQVGAFIIGCLLGWDFLCDKCREDEEGGW